MAVKNLRTEHLEDEIINNGINGGRGAINFLRGLGRHDEGVILQKVLT